MSQTLILGPDNNGLTVVCDGPHVREVRHGEVPAIEGARHLDCAGATLRPGHVCAHTHIYSGLAPLGMPAPEQAPTTFVEILERVWWRLDRALDEATLRASARLYVANTLLAGTTTLIDHHESPNFIAGSLDVLADACDELGVRALLCYGLTERNGGAAEAEAGLAECARFMHDNRRPLVHGMIGLHASFTMSDHGIRAAAALARSRGVGLHVHVAEAASDEADARARGYDDVVDRLAKLDALLPRSIFAHGVHAAVASVRLAADAGVWWVHNPRSNQGNQVGYATQLQHCDRVALGTDGYPAEMDVEQAALTELGAAHGDATTAMRARLPRGRDMVAELTGAPLTSLTPDATGTLADIVVDDAHGARHVLVHGAPVVIDHALVRADIASIRADASAAAPGLWARMQAF